MVQVFIQIKKIAVLVSVFGIGSLFGMNNQPDWKNLPLTRKDLRVLCVESPLNSFSCGMNTRFIFAF